MIDLQTSRLTAFRYRLPLTIWYVLVLFALVSLFMVGYQIGLSGRRWVKLEFLLVLIFAAVIFLITDLDRPAEGYFRVNEQSMFDLLEQLQEDPAPTRARRGRRRAGPIRRSRPTAHFLPLQFDCTAIVQPEPSSVTLLQTMPLAPS